MITVGYAKNAPTHGYNLPPFGLERGEIYGAWIGLLSSNSNLPSREYGRAREVRVICKLTVG